MSKLQIKFGLSMLCLTYRTLTGVPRYYYSFCSFSASVCWAQLQR